MHDPSRCDCCTGVKALTPVAVLNAPGQSALAYRVGTHGRFVQTQLAALSGQPALADLSTRERSDPALAAPHSPSLGRSRSGSNGAFPFQARASRRSIAVVGIRAQP